MVWHVAWHVVNACNPDPGPCLGALLRQANCVTTGGDGSEEADNDAGNAVGDRLQQKACLERYRKACYEILAVFHAVAPEVRHCIRLGVSDVVVCLTTSLAWIPYCS